MVNSMQLSSKEMMRDLQASSHSAVLYMRKRGKGERRRERGGREQGRRRRRMEEGEGVEMREEGRNGRWDQEKAEAGEGNRE